MVWSEGNMSLKFPVTPPGIDPGTVRLVAQRLNHCATPGPLYNVIWKNMVQSYKPRITIQYGACALHAGYLRLQTHTQNVILIAFLLQNWLHERASLLRYTHIACLALQ